MGMHGEDCDCEYDAVMENVSRVAQSIYRAARGDYKDEQDAANAMADGLLYLFDSHMVVNLAVLFGETVDKSVVALRVIKKAQEFIDSLDIKSESASTLREELTAIISDVPDVVFQDKDSVSLN